MLSLLYHFGQSDRLLLCDAEEGPDEGQGTTERSVFCPSSAIPSVVASLHAPPAPLRTIRGLDEVNITVSQGTTSVVVDADADGAEQTSIREIGPEQVVVDVTVQKKGFEEVNLLFGIRKNRQEECGRAESQDVCMYGRVEVSHVKSRTRGSSLGRNGSGHFV